MEVALLVLVVILAGFSGFMFTELQTVKNKELTGLPNEEFNQIMSIVEVMIDKKVKPLQGQNNEYLDSMSKKIIKEATEYTDKRCKSLNDKFFHVIDLDK